MYMYIYIYIKSHIAIYIYYLCICFIQAEELLVKGFPEKIVKLNELLETPGFCNRKLSDVHQDLNVPIPEPIILNHSPDAPATKKLKLDNNGEETSGTKVMVLPTGAVPCNKKLCDLIHIVKPYIRQLLEDSNLVSMLRFICRVYIFYRVYYYNIYKG